MGGAGRAALAVFGVIFLLIGILVGFVGTTEFREETRFGPQGFGVYEVQYQTTYPSVGIFLIFVAIGLFAAAIKSGDRFDYATEGDVLLEGLVKDSIEEVLGRREKDS